jgi:hypothetical protein
MAKNYIVTIGDAPTSSCDEALLMQSRQAVGREESPSK